MCQSGFCKLFNKPIHHSHLYYLSLYIAWLWLLVMYCEQHSPGCFQNDWRHGGGVGVGGLNFLAWTTGLHCRVTGFLSMFEKSAKQRIKKITDMCRRDPEPLSVLLNKSESERNMRHLALYETKLWLIWNNKNKRIVWANSKLRHNWNVISDTLWLW